LLRIKAVDLLVELNMTSTTPLPIALGRFKQLPQRSNEVWQGGLVKLPAWIDNPHDPGGPPYRPTGALWVSLRTGLLHMALPDAGEAATPELALKALIEFGLRESRGLNGRPSVIEVRDPQMRDALSGPLSALNTTVALVEELPVVAGALRSLEAAAGDGLRHAGMLEGTGVTADQLRGFADAAAAFFRAEPWRHLTNEDLIVVNTPQVPKGMRHVCVLGNAGQQFGLAFFESRQEFERIYSRAGSVLPRRAFGVTYGPIDDLPFADVDAWDDLSLAVVNPLAYPLAADLADDGTMRRLTAAELAVAEALLQALAQTTEDELDSGSWRHVVETFAGPMTLELTLPFLLETEGGRPSGSKLCVMPRLAERASVRLARLFDSQSFESLDAANAAIQRAEADGLFEMSAEAAAGRPPTALERAQELAYDAMEATGRLRIKLARRALEVSQDCADAHVVLGEASASPQEAREWYQRGVDAGARALGPEKLASLEGEFWEHLETRPYMRARLALAQTLEELGQEDDALDLYRELLRLNPNDYQGVRYLLLPALLEQGGGDEADRLLSAYEGDIQAMWPYAQALRAFQIDGDSTRARAALKGAIRINPHVVQYLLDPDALPPDAPSHSALGSREEAAYVAEGLGAAFDASPGALSWLQRIGARLHDGRRGKRSRRR
jgi:tetratricopeptide (TPR) repeat protein